MALLPSLFEPRTRFPSTMRRSLFANMDDIMNEAFRELSTGQITGQRQFPIDVEDMEDKYVIEAELPGVQKKDLDITLQDRLLTIQVKQSGEKEEKERNYVMQERWSGGCSRSILLPKVGSESSVDASLKDGILRVNVKKEESSRAQRIEVQ